MSNLPVIPHEGIIRLIEEIERRPPLYQKSLKEYLDVGLKKQLWDEVCFAVFKDWNKLAPEEKFKQAQDLQKKWHNIRSCFTRELRAQERQTADGPGASKRRKYIYFNKLQFLLNADCVHSSGRKRKSWTPASNPCLDNNDQTEETSNEDDEDAQDEKKYEGHLPTVHRKVKRRVEREKEENKFDEEQLLKVLTMSPQAQEETNCVIDEETNFVLSLVPTLKSLPEECKLQARIEILSILQKMKFGRSTSQECHRSTCSEESP